MQTDPHWKKSLKSSVSPKCQSQIKCCEISQCGRVHTHVATKNRVAAPKVPLRNSPLVLLPPESQPGIAHDIGLWPRLFQGWYEDGRLVLCPHPIMKVTSGDNCELCWVGVRLP